MLTVPPKCALMSIATTVAAAAARVAVLFANSTIVMPDTFAENQIRIRQARMNPKIKIAIPTTTISIPEAS